MAEEMFTPTMMPLVGPEGIDPATGMVPEPIRPQLLFLKLAATGAATVAQFVFLKWHSYKQKSLEAREQQQQQQQQFENNMAVLAIQSTPGMSDADTPQQAYDWNALEVSEQQQRSFPQLLAECRELRQQLRDQKVQSEKKLEEEKAQHNQYLL